MIQAIKQRIKSICEIVQNPVMSILPGQLAFSFILTIIPVLILVALIASTFGLSLDLLIDFITKSFPAAVSNLLIPLIRGKGFDLSILLFLIMSLWLASNGPYAVITASDVIYNIKPQKYVPKKIKSLLMTIILIALILFMLIVIAFGDKIILWLSTIQVLSSVMQKVAVIYGIIKYPLSFVMIYFGVKLIYTIAPNKLIKSTSVTAGSIFTTIMWILVSEIYSIWVSNSNYDIFYVSISNILVLLIWAWFLAYIFAIGLIMNSSIENDTVVSSINNKDIENNE